MAVRKTLVLQHANAEHLGLIAEVLLEKEVEPTYCRPYLGDTVPTNVGDYQGVILMGGPQSVYQEEEFPYLKAEKVLVSWAVEKKLGVLGICLGSQILADVLGAHVYPGQTFELGWKDLHVSTSASDDPVFAPLPKDFVPFHWHGDIYDLPKGAIPFGSSNATPVQGFSYDKRHYGLLCHLEMTEKQIIEMSSIFPDDLSRGNIDQSTLLAETPQRLSELRDIALAVFQRWTDLL